MCTFCWRFTKRAAEPGSIKCNHGARATKRDGGVVAAMLLVPGRPPVVLYSTSSARRIPAMGISRTLTRNAANFPRVEDSTLGGLLDVCRCTRFHPLSSAPNEGPAHLVYQGFPTNSAMYGMAEGGGGYSRWYAYQ